MAKTSAKAAARATTKTGKVSSRVASLIARQVAAANQRRAEATKPKATPRKGTNIVDLRPRKGTAPAKTIKAKAKATPKPRTPREEDIVRLMSTITVGELMRWNDNIEFVDENNKPLPKRTTLLAACGG